MPIATEENRDLRRKITLMEQALGRATFELFQRPQLRAACASVVAALTVPDPAEAVKFYAEVLGAQEGFRINDEQGRVAHAALQIGDSQLFINSEYPELGMVSPNRERGSAVTIHVFVEDARATYRQAVEYGCKAVAEPREEFWGEVRATVIDPFGHQWILSTNREPLSVSEIVRRAEKQFGRHQG